MAGDFNEILFSYEKRGGLLCNERQMNAFGKALEDCMLGVWVMKRIGILRRGVDCRGKTFVRDWIRLLQMGCGNRCFLIVGYSMRRMLFQTIVRFFFIRSMRVVVGDIVILSLRSLGCWRKYARQRL